MKTIKLTQGYEAIVDDNDYEWLIKYKWHIRFSGSGNIIYADTCFNGKTTPMHRLILGIEDNPKLQCDHKNGNGLDNRRCNLRFATNTQNQWNSNKRFIRKGKPITSKYKGVSLHKQTGRWTVNTRFNDKRIHLGLYAVEEDAAKAYNEFAKKYHGEFAKLNIFKEVK